MNMIDFNNSEHLGDILVKLDTLIDLRAEINSLESIKDNFSEPYFNTELGVTFDSNIMIDAVNAQLRQNELKKNLLIRELTKIIYG